MERPTKAHRTQIVSSLVTIHFLIPSSIAINEKELRSLLHKQMNQEKTYVASVEDKIIKIFDSRNWMVIQTINQKAHFASFSSRDELLIGYAKTIRVWSIRHAKFTKKMHTKLKTDNVFYTNENIVALCLYKTINVVDAHTAKLYTKEADQRIAFVCISNNQIITTHNTGYLSFWTLSLEPIRTINTNEQYLRFVCPWFDNKILLVSQDINILFNLGTCQVEQHLDHTILYTQKYGNKIIAKDMLQGICICDKSGQVKQTNVGRTGPYYSSNPFRIVGSKLLHVPLNATGHNIMVYDLETFKLEREVQTKSLQVYTFNKGT
jgi:hypothetical protein